MEALQRSVLSNNWITLIFVFSILLLFFLKLFTTAKLKGYVTSLFNKGFVEIEAEENYWTLSFFHVGFSLFTFLMLSVTTFFLISQFNNSSALLLEDYLVSTSYLFSYVVLRFIVVFALFSVFQFKSKLSFFMTSKRGYLYSISIGLLFLNVFYFYTFQYQDLLFTGFVALFSLRFSLILINNKNLIIKELFYFILYLCAFELAPLFVLFRLIF
jgi:hypothetical protein